jgi:hypothetical protein
MSSDAGPSVDPANNLIARIHGVAYQSANIPGCRQADGALPSGRSGSCPSEHTPSRSAIGFRAELAWVGHTLGHGLAGPARRGGSPV